HLNRLATPSLSRLKWEAKQNVNGTDLFPRLCQMLEARGASLFLLGGQPGVAESVADVIRQQWPQLRIAGIRDGFFEVSQEGVVAAEVSASKADMVLVARGVPMQDVFIDRHLPQLGVMVAIGVGGLFDFVSGRINRAPTWMRDTGLEWIYRWSPFWIGGCYK
ncbi:MAG: WecB/TagA/CpsF family glycosyltransferase, partial [Leptolinea sp.]